MGVNGSPVQVTGKHETAVDELRTELGLTGTKLVCGTGVCGACTVLVGDVPVTSCLLPAERLAADEITTIEGIGDGERLHPVQAAFLAHDGLQCGYCTPGFVVEAKAFYDRWRAEMGTQRPERETIARALAGHLCRCGAYDGIYRAVADACAGMFDGGDETGPRVDGREKVTGAAKYTTDVHLDGLVGRIVRSSIPHGTLIEVDATAALAIPGVRSFVRLANEGDRIRYYGQPLAAVAAVDEVTARDAARRVVVVTDPRPAAVGAEQAQEDDAPDVHGWWIPPSNNEGPSVPNFRRKNLVGPTPLGTTRPIATRRRLAAARRDGALNLIEGNWTTSVQSHTALEPHAAVAEWTEDGKLLVHLSTQGVTANRTRLAKAVGLAPDDVEMTATYIGGAFGAKQALGIEPVAAALLARSTGAPVRVILDRGEELAFGGNRPGTDIDLALLGTEDRLEAISVRAVADGGASAGSLVASFLPRFTYPGAPRLLLDYDAVSNAPPGTAFRAPGGPPALFALEQAVDALADRLQIDAVELRRRWNRRPLREAVYDWVAGHPLWSERSSAPESVGVGVAFGTWFNGHQPGTEVTVASTRTGLTVSAGTQDMGNGTRTALAAAVAEVFGVDRSTVRVEIGSSSLGPGPMSSGSRTTLTVWPTARRAAMSVQQRLVEQARTELGLGGAEAVEGGLTHAGEILLWTDLLPRLRPETVTATRPRDHQRLVPFSASIGGVEFGKGLTESAHLVEVEVDPALGMVKVGRVDSVIAAGHIHAPELATSQVHGGVIQGIGMALYEQRRLDPHTGAVTTATLEDYRLAGIGDSPEMEVEFLEDGFEHLAGGGAGLSELSHVAVPAAIANAVAAATGRRFHSLPILPSEIVDGRW